MSAANGLRPTELNTDAPIDYAATPDGICEGKTRVSLHMRRWMSRLTLTVTEVRIERLQEISDADIWSECNIDQWAGNYLDRKHGPGGGSKLNSIRHAFRSDEPTYELQSLMRS